MNDTELDDLLTRAAAHLPAATVCEAQRLARATAPRRPVRRRWVLPVAIAGAVALTAGSGVTMTMAHWGGVEMPLGNVRNQTPIPVRWTTDSGLTETCRVWVELRHPEPTDVATLDRAIAGHDWAGLGQRLYDQAPVLPDDADGERRVGDALGPVLHTFAQQVFPGAGWFSDAGTGRAVDAWGMRCDQ